MIHANEQVSKVMLERFKFHMQHEFTQEAMDDGIFTMEVINRIAQNMAFRVRADIFGHKLDQIVWKVPANWKESVKERFFPKWLLKRYPVRMQVFRIDPLVLYPQIKLPNEKHYFRFERNVE